MACPRTHRQGRRRAVLRLAVLGSLCLGACTYRAQVPAVDGAHLGDIGGRQPGRFAALVQKDAWRMKVDVAGLACAPHTYQLDVEPSWDQAMRNALVAALGTVDFVPAIGPPASLPVPYDAQIGIVQSDASAHVEVAPKMFGLDAVAETKLKGALTIVYPDGSFQYETIEATGWSRSSGLTCGAVSPALGQASAQALRAIVERAAMTAKLRLAQHRSGEAQPAAASNPPVTWQDGQMVK
jgi:hypothetical protein